MSADAKVWQDADGDWHATHDGHCNQSAHQGNEYDLVALLGEVEECIQSGMRWEFRTYADGEVGLVGYGY